MRAQPVNQSFAGMWQSYCIPSAYYCARGSIDVVLWAEDTWSTHLSLCGRVRVRVDLKYTQCRASLKTVIFSQSEGVRSGCCSLASHVPNISQLSWPVMFLSKPELCLTVLTVLNMFCQQDQQDLHLRCVNKQSKTSDWSDWLDPVAHGTAGSGLQTGVVPLFATLCNGRLLTVGNFIWSPRSNLALPKADSGQGWGIVSGFYGTWQISPPT